VGIEVWSLVVAVVSLMISGVAVVVATRPSLTVGDWEPISDMAYRIVVGNTGRGGAKHVRVVLTDSTGKPVAKSGGAGEILHNGKSISIPVTLPEQPQFPLRIIMEHEWLGKTWKPKSKVQIPEKQTSVPSRRSLSSPTGSPGSSAARMSPKDSASPVDPKLLISAATPPEVWLRLGEHNVEGRLSPMTWEDLLTIGEQLGGIGEIAAPLDWYSFPEEDHDCRVAAVVTGSHISIRWANSVGFKRSGLRPSHENLFGPTEGKARTGYVLRHGDQLTITT
jgi:hypothetical protein